MMKPSQGWKSEIQDAGGVASAPMFVPLPSIWRKLIHSSSVLVLLTPMKNIAAWLFFLFPVPALLAQGSVPAMKHSSDAAQRVFDGQVEQKQEPIYGLSEVEVQPEFPGGMAEMYTYLQGAIHYPDQALKDNVEGKVYIDFIVGADGKVRDAKILRAVRQDMDAEAIRAVNAMPPWTPGKLGGKAVSTRFVLPISFVSGKSPSPSSK
jgi:TonB family protein